MPLLFLAFQVREVKVTFDNKMTFFFFSPPSHFWYQTLKKMKGAKGYFLVAETKITARQWIACWVAICHKTQQIFILSRWQSNTIKPVKLQYFLKMKSHLLSLMRGVLVGSADYMLHTSYTKEEIGFLLLFFINETQQIWKMVLTSPFKYSNVHS